MQATPGRVLPQPTTSPALTRTNSKTLKGLTRRWAAGRCTWLGVLLLGLVCLLRVFLWATASLRGYGSLLPVSPKTPILATGRNHLLLYAFSYTDTEFPHNLEYFVKEAVIGDTIADYVIIVQEGPELKVRQQRQAMAAAKCPTASANCTGGWAGTCTGNFYGRAV
eukprot:GHRQ01033555.1.p1 GENE.GHRQ01033555.1~~GHRQ01033555.1.p1  ORF type:complete len:166 (+),score=18.36 GHRQ01033555.1:193-690(+)